MTFAELLTEVYALTKRPDLVDLTTSAVRAATLKLHGSDFFPRDLVETGISFSSAEYLQQIDYYSLFSNFRALKYIRKTDSTGEEQGPFFEVIVPEQVLDGYGVNKENVCYVAGQVIQIRSAAPVQYILFGYYAYPNVTPALYSSFIAVTQPFAIVYDAAARVFKTIGDTEQFAAYTAMALDEKKSVVASNVQAIGY